MNHTKFINEQQMLADISHAYKNDPAFKKMLDDNPKAIFQDESFQNAEGEVVIMQNTGETYYFVLGVNGNQAIEDDDISNINAAKLISATVSVDNVGTRDVFGTESGNLYRRYKADPSDPGGKSHFVQVAQTGKGLTFHDISSEVISQDQFV